ncbi:uncharacterized protein LOC62_02G002901 [Vanrija pseudolonga]|uniref:Uncharacterized protein n=1 Tax=Vanrija pseudolonga TaxID=143232 RepID=A0AAF1BGW1_9TREE|nr:hypothetical protein LOC62_02G002901 [Vanrija pseudolonga]
MSLNENTGKKRRATSEVEGDATPPTKKARSDDECSETTSSSEESEDADAIDEIFDLVCRATSLWEEWRARATDRNRAETRRSASVQLLGLASTHCEDTRLALLQAVSASDNTLERVVTVHDAMGRWREALSIKIQAEIVRLSDYAAYNKAEEAADKASRACVEWFCADGVRRGDGYFAAARFSDLFEDMFPDSGTWGEEFKAVLKRLADATHRDAVPK